LRGSPVTKAFHSKERVIDQQVLERAIRGHGNLTEYAPLFLILMLALELSDASKYWLYVNGSIFTLGRTMHGVVFAFMKPNPFMRIGGMTLTFMGFLGLIASAIYL
jgi:hypothetical protein